MAEDSVNYKITCCDKCPHMKSERHHTDDWFEEEYEWKCALANMLHITYHDWHDRSHPIPHWCPLRKEE